MGDERGPWIGSSWMVTAMPGGDGPRPRVLLTWIVGVVLLLGVLGAAGPHPVSAALPLPPADTSEVGATGALPQVGAAPPSAALPLPLPSSSPSAPLPGSGPDDGSGSGVPQTMLAAYRGAQTSMAAAAPGCHLSWALVAGIGKVESGHAYGGAVTADGTTVSPILGPELNGTSGNAAIADTDGGVLDHDTVWDRAVGPTQFIPTSWRTYGADGNGDGVADPDNAFDAALATGRYLCAGGGDLATAAGRHDAVFRYNHSESYVATVLRWADTYASGALPVPDSDGGIPDPALASGNPTLAALRGPSSVPTAGGAAGLTAPATSSASVAGGLVGGSPVSVGVPSAAVPPAPPSVPSVPSVSVVPVAPGTSSPTPRSATGSSAPAPSAPAPSSAVPPTSTTAPAPAAPPTTTTPPSTTTIPPPSTTTPPPSSSTTTPRTTAPSVAQRCTASLPAVAKAFGVPVDELTAATSDGPEAGQATCTVSRSGKPLVVAVAATTASAPAPTPGAGVSRTVPGGRVVLSVPPAAKVPAATATAALTKLATAWA